MKKIIFCIPGSNFSVRFMRCWTNLVKELETTDYEWDFTFHYNPEVHMARNEILGGKSRSSPDLLPWNGDREYDYIMWIDSDIIFNPTDFFMLLEHNIDIVSGLYYRQDGPLIENVPTNFACASHELKHLTWVDLESSKGELIDVHGNGMGFMLVKYGVFEKLGFPWFESQKIEYEIKGIKKVAFYSEDITFQMKALKELGIKSYVDPRVIVGHEKPVILK